MTNRPKSPTVQAGEVHRAPVDSQGAEDDKYHEGFDDAARMSQICGKLSAEDAATQMRTACVDAIKGLRSVPHGAAYNNAINDAISKIESLTLDQVKQK